ncbi:nuclear transport factor 2 family protein [Geodermatophilus sp. SYSU D00691]
MAEGEESAVAVVRELVAAQDAHDVPRMLRCMTDDVVYEDVALGSREQGHADVARMLGSLEERVSADYRISTGQVLVAGDGYAVEWVLEGTNDRADPEFGLPATGNRFSLRGVSTGRLRDGRIAENHDYWNMADFLAQLGLLSGLRAAPAAG